MTRLGRIGRRLLALASAAILGTVLFGQPAHASVGSVVNFGSGLCLQPFADSYPGHVVSVYDNGIPIKQVACNGSPEQQWTKVFIKYSQPPGAGCFGGCVLTGQLYYMVNNLTGKCMDVKDASTSNGAPIQQWECNGGGSEQWWLDETTGYQSYINARTKKCLDVPYGTFSQTTMWQYTCNSTYAQLFSVP